jgi:predicted RNase H-like HicB family nuclease
MHQIAVNRPYGAIVDGKRGSYGVVIPDLPGCTAMGKTVDEALANAASAARAWAEVARADGAAIPHPRPLEELRADADVRAELEAGGALAIAARPARLI